MGDDSGRLCVLFQDGRRSSNSGGAVDWDRIRLLGNCPRFMDVDW